MSLLAKQEKSTLLALAREAIRAKLWGEEFHSAGNDSPAFGLPAGAFVTLHKGTELRGCIGRIRTVDRLDHTVPHMAIAAAFEDPRFSPVTREEFSLLSIEISVLSPPEVITDVSQIEVGRHGLIVSQGPYSGLLLPQVAQEWGWNAEEFLSHTCAKAGLPENYWRSAVPRIETFTAEVFSEAPTI